MKKLFGAIVLVVALSGCSKQSEMVLQKEVDSLRLEVSVSKQMNATLQQIGTMIDSLDVLRSELSKGAYTGKPERLRDINKYVASMQSKSAEIEHELEKGTGSAAIYAGIISRLNNDLTAKTLELTAIAEQVTVHKGVNDTLRMIVDLQAAEINEGAARLTATEQEIHRLDDEVKHLTLEAKSHVADSYDERALALEEAAKRTHLALERSKNF